MKIDTKIFGEIEVEEKSAVSFGDGMLGLEAFKKYVLISLPGNDKFFCLQSREDPALAFFLINPWDFFPSYELNIADEKLGELGISKPEQTSVYCILTVLGDIKDITANLLAPIVINIENNEGKQVVLDESKYKTKHRLFHDKGV